VPINRLYFCVRLDKTVCCLRFQGSDLQLILFINDMAIRCILSELTVVYEHLQFAVTISVVCASVVMHHASARHRLG